MNLTSGLVGYWSLDGDDISGTTAYDRSGSGNNGTLTNGPTKTAGRIGQALSFDGGDDYVTISSSSALSIGTAATYSTWVKMNALPPSSYGYSLIRKWSNGSEDKTLAIAQNGKPNLFFYNVGSGVNANTVLSTGVWHHIVGTYDGTTEKIYIDGVLDNSNSASGDVADNVGAAVTLGHTPENSAYLNGFLDDVRIYNRSLSATEVRALYDVGNPDKVNTAQGDSLEQGLAGYWKLDDASGTTATDSSGNANNGTLTNGPTWGTGQVKGDTVFDGVNDYVTTPNSTAIDMGANQDFTLALWVKTSQAATAGQHPMMLSKEDVNNPRQGYNMFLHAQTDDPTWYLELFSNGTAAYAVGKSNIADGQWHHIVGMRKGGRLYSYEDGGLATVNAAGFTGSLSKNIPLRFGRSSGSGWYFNGSLDEVRIYNRALSSEEVGKLYRETAPDNPDTGLVGYWPFNGKDISGTTAYDRSGKGMNGTLTNGPTRTAGRIGQALNFDGTDDRVNVGDVKTTGNFTYAAWVKVLISLLKKRVCLFVELIMTFQQ